VLVKGLSGVTAIAAGGEFSLARLSNGTLMAWGAGEEGQLGNGKKAKSATPVLVKGLSEVVAIAAGREHALALLANGTVMSWGSNLSLQLGPPTDLFTYE
jgi:alpha-tubulin suppressor-like RCC1 family protein